MNTRDYLSQLRNIDNRIKNLLRNAEKWYDIATSTGSTDYSAPKVQTTVKSDRIGDVVGKVVDYQNESKVLAEEKIELKHTIISQIEGLRGEKEEIYYNLLYGFYVDKKRFNEMAAENNYSDSQTKRKFSEAIRKFEKMYGTLYLDK